ncbi:hypothetical protein HYW42_04280 [Candidatus Daviesbacteria bacterium]|nr:hypothetical protein [Candidatus Daviesbacteria bacterium]
MVETGNSSDFKITVNNSPNSPGLLEGAYLLELEVGGNISSHPTVQRVARVVAGMGYMMRWAELMSGLAAAVLPENPKDLLDLRQRAHGLMIDTDRGIGYARQLTREAESLVEADNSSESDLAEPEALLDKVKAFGSFIVPMWVHDMNNHLTAASGMVYCMHKNPARLEYPNFRESIIDSFSLIHKELLQEALNQDPALYSLKFTSLSRLSMLINIVLSTVRKNSMQNIRAVNSEFTNLPQEIILRGDVYLLYQLLKQCAGNSAKQARFKGESYPTEFGITTQLAADGNTAIMYCDDNGSGYSKLMIEKGFIGALRERQAGNIQAQGYRDNRVPTTGFAMAMLTEKAERAGIKVEPARRTDKNGKVIPGARTAIYVPVLSN